MRRLLAALVVGAILVPAPAMAAVPVLVIDGRGFGHGVGMAQDGAFWMAKAGAATEKILSHFYPGTTLGKAGGSVRVPVLDLAAPASTTLVFPAGGEVRALGGGGSEASSLSVPAGGRVRVGWDGRRHKAQMEPRGRALPAPERSGGAAGGGMRLGGAAGGGMRLAGAASSTSTTAPPLLPTTLVPPLEPPTIPTTTTTAPPATDAPSGEEQPADEGRGSTSSTQPLVAVPARGGTVALPDRDRHYRGQVEIVGRDGRLRLLNHLDVEQYLKGMGEVRDPSWPPAALRAQAIAARTYALRAMGSAGEVCETQRCQVYLGAQAEYGAMDKAVDATRGQVVLFRRALASAVYSANGGGFSAAPEEGFGTVGKPYPYLRAAPYETKDVRGWTVRVALADVGRRFGYRGRVTDVRAARAGPSGRVLEVVIEGSRGPVAVPGITFDAALGLRSTLFELRVEQAEEAPPPPEADAVIQLPPGEDADPAVDYGSAGGSDAVPSATELAGAATVADPGRVESSAPIGAVLLAALLVVRMARRVSRAAGRMRPMGARR